MDAWEFAEEVDVLPKLPADFDEKRESKKWQERKEALDALNALLESSIRLSTKASYGEILGNLQTMLAKDANINVCALTAKCIKGFATGLRSKFSPYAQTIIPIVFDKLKEKKPVLRDPLVECADAIAATLPSLEIIVEEIESNMGKPNPQIKQQVDNFLYRQINLITPDKAPKKLIKAVVPLLAKHSADADQDVREAALSTLGAIQRLIGDKNVRSMIGDLTNDETKLKKIAECAEKAAKLHSEEMAKLSTGSAAQAAGDEATAPTEGSSRPSAPTPAAVAVKEADPWDFLEVVDVLAKLPDDFNTNIESKKWTERRDALQAFLDLLTANPKLDPKASYGEHVSLLKRIIEKDANINVAALAAKCMKGIAEGLRKKFAPHAAAVVPVVFDKFKEKKPLLRDPLVECIDAIAATTTLEAMGEDVIAALEKQNPNIKIQTDLFLYRAFKLLNAQTMPKKTLKAIAPLLVKHTGDSDAEVRDASYAALGSAMRAIGEKPCLPLLSDIIEDKLKMGKIKEFYQKACEEAGPEVITQMVQSIHKADAAPPPTKKVEPSVKKGTSDSSTDRQATSPEEEEPDGDDESLKPPAGVAAVKKVPEKKKEVPKKVEEEEEPVKKPPNELLSANDEKQQRLKDERTLKVLKWNFTLPTEEHIAQLQEQLGRYAKASFMGMLFHKDFKQHLKAVEMLNKAAETNPETLVKNSDLLLKWCTLRFYETNPAVLIKVLEFAKQVLVLVRAFDEPMSSEEMYAFVPHLLLKSGEQKESMRNAVREIIDEITDICGPLKMCPTLLEALKTKNARQRAECLQVLEQYVARAGLTQLKSLGIHKAIAACVSDRDNNVRNAAINGLVACYREEGDQMWRNVGKMGDKERAMVEERIKRSGAAPGSAAPRGGGGGAVKIAGAKIVVPPGAGSAVRRPNSRSASARRDNSQSRTRDNSPDDEKGELNGTFSVHRDEGALNTTVNYGQRYKIDEDYVEQGADGLKTTHELAELDRVQLRQPSRSSAPPMPSTPIKRSGSSSSISSIDTMDQLEKVIQNISSGLIDVAKDALEQVQYLLSVDDQRALLEDRLDMVMQTVGTQLKLVRNMHGIHTPKGRDLLKLILNFLTPLTTSADKYARMNIGEDAAYGILWELVHTLIKTQSDPLCAAMPDSVQFGRSLNALIIRLCIQVERTIFFAACARCLMTSLLDDAEGDAAQLFIKCMYKWADTMAKQKTVLDMDLYLRSANRFYDQIQPGYSTHKLYADGIRSVEMCSEQAMVAMGPMLLEKLKRLPKANPHFVELLQACYAECQKISPAGWGVSLPGAVPDAAVQKPHIANGQGRSELHILVDNVIRDLANVEKHTSLLVSYMDKNPQDAGRLDKYLETVPLGGLVRDLMEQSRAHRMKKIGSVTEQQVVSAAQSLFTMRSRFEAMRHGRDPMTLSTSMISSVINPVLQARDTNADSFSEPAIPVPDTMNETKARLSTNPQKKRRTIDPATHIALQTRLAGLGAD